MSVDENNSYTAMQRKFYDGEAVSGRMNEGNHAIHNDNPDYWDILVCDTAKGYGRKIGLDFGCGCGRNVLNLVERFKRFDGVDISKGLAEQAAQNMRNAGHDESRFAFHHCNGVDLECLKSNEYDFVMSTIVLQHICVYDIRLSYLKEFYRILKNKGLLSFQMRYRQAHGYAYHENMYDATGTNGQCDVIVSDEKQIIDDLEMIGYRDIKTMIRPAWPNDKESWIYVKAYK